MKSNADKLRKIAQGAGIPARTRDQVCTSLAKARATGADMELARLMLKHGRMTEEARQFVIDWLAD